MLKQPSAIAAVATDSLGVASLPLDGHGYDGHGYDDAMTAPTQCLATMIVLTLSPPACSDPPCEWPATEHSDEAVMVIDSAELGVTEVIPTTLFRLSDGGLGLAGSAFGPDDGLLPWFGRLTVGAIEPLNTPAAWLKSRPGSRQVIAAHATSDGGIRYATVSAVGEIDSDGLRTWTFEFEAPILATVHGDGAFVVESATNSLALVERGEATWVVDLSTTLGVLGIVANAQGGALLGREGGSRSNYARFDSAGNVGRLLAVEDGCTNCQFRAAAFLTDRNLAWIVTGWPDVNFVSAKTVVLQVDGDDNLMFRRQLDFSRFRQPHFLVEGPDDTLLIAGTICAENPTGPGGWILAIDAETGADRWVKRFESTTLPFTDERGCVWIGGSMTAQGDFRILGFAPTGGSCTLAAAP